MSVEAVTAEITESAGHDPVASIVVRHLAELDKPLSLANTAEVLLLCMQIAREAFEAGERNGQADAR